MARKSKQHIVPQTYLRGFCDPTPPDGWPLDKPFEPCVWVQPRDLSGEAKRKAPVNVAWERELYNLPGDDPEHPWLEEALAKMEGLFSTTRSRIEKGEQLGVEDRVVLAMFAGTMQERTKEMLQQRREFFEQLAHFTRQMEPEEPTPERQKARDQFWDNFGDEAKRQFGSMISGFAEAVGPHSVILVNDTYIPFVTGDSPTSYRQIHGDELLSFGLPEALFYRGIPRSARGFFVLLPLSPKMAFMATHFIPVDPVLRFCPLPNPWTAFCLNEITRESANSEIYSSIQQPYADLLGVAKEHERLQRKRENDAKPFISLYSKAARYWIEVTSVAHGQGEHVLHGQLRFKTADIRTLRALANDNHFRELTFSDALGGSGGMRGARFISVALDETGESVLENRPEWSLDNARDRQAPRSVRGIEVRRARPPARRVRKPQTTDVGEQKRMPGRNDLCHCGSGKKYKHCHLRADEDNARALARNPSDEMDMDDDAGEEDFADETDRWFGYPEDAKGGVARMLDPGTPVCMVFQIAADDQKELLREGRQFPLGSWAVSTGAHERTVIHGPYSTMKEAFDLGRTVGAKRFMTAPMFGGFGEN